VQAAKLMVTTDVSGTVLDVAVREGQSVRAGDVLFRLDPRPFEIALASAKSDLAQTALNIQSMKSDYARMLSDVASQQAQLTFAETDYKRQAALLTHGGAARATVDQSRAQLGTARATLEALRQQANVQLAKLGGNIDTPVEQHPLYRAALAKVEEAQRQLDHTTVRAPFDGIVTQVSSLQKGAQVISAMAAFMPTSAVGLVGTRNLWVEANLKETDLEHVREGNAVEIDVDALPDHACTGRVVSLAPATGAQFSVLPAQNASGNWVKVTQRIPVRISVDCGAHDQSLLRAGMSVIVSVDTGHSRSLSDLF
jgi:membrane fusion protein (multidrug efflux system)